MWPNLGAGVLIAMCLHAPAHAHADAPAGLAPWLDESGDLIGGITTYGLLTRDEDRWAWTCTAPDTVRFSWAAPDLSRIVWSDGGRGLSETTDLGCTVQRRNNDLQEHFVVDGRAHEGALYALTGSPDRDNALFVSTDGAGSFEVFADLTGLLPISLTDAGPNGFVVTATAPPAAIPQLYTISPGGEVAPAHPGPAWALATVDGTLVVSAPAGTGHAVGPLGEAPWFVFDVRPEALVGAGDEIVVLFADETSARFRKSGERIGDDVFEHCLHRRGDVVVGCASLRDEDFLLLEGGNIRAPVAYKDIVSRDCPADSQAAVCADDFALWQEIYGIGHDRETAPPPDGGGCAGVAPVGYAPLFALWLVLRRRRG